MALTVPAMSHTTHENNNLMNAHPSTFWPQSNHISSSAPVDAYVQSGSPPSPSHHGHQAYYDENNMMMNMMEMQRNYLLTGSGSPPMNGNGEGRPQRSGSATGSGNRTPSRNSSSQDQYSAQLYKTELCRSFKDTGYCRYGLKCRFAHGTPDLRPVQRHKKYKTEKCKNYQRDGNCPYGDRCRFLHEDGELEELLLAEQMDGLVQATVSGTGSQNTSVPASPYFTATGSPPQENELDLRGSQHLYESGTSSRFITKPITTARGSMIGSTPPHHSYHPHNPYAQHNTSQSVPTNLDLHPSLYRRGQELTGSISSDFSYGSPHITYGGNDDDEVLGRLDDDDGWMTHQQRVAKKQQEHARQQYQQQQQQHQTFQQHLDVTSNNNDDYNNFNSHLTQHHSPLLLHRGNQSSDDIDRLTDDVMDAQSAVRSAFTTSDMTSFHSQSTPVSLGSTPTAPTRSPLLLSAVPRSPIIGPSVWSTTVTETRTAGSTPGHATPTGFSTAPRSSTSIPSSSQGSPFFSSVIPPPSGRSTGAMPAFSLSSSAQPIPGVSHMRSTSGNLSRTQALAMEMTKGTDEAVGDDDLLATTSSSRRKKAIVTSFLSTTRAPQLSMDGDDVDEFDLHALTINDVTPTACSASDEDTPATGRFRSVSLNLPTHTSSQAISINATSTSTTTSTASWYGSATASPTSSSSNQSPHANAFSHSFSLPSAATTLSTSVPRGVPSPLQRFQAPLQSTATATTTSSTTSGSSSPSAAPSSPHGPMGSTPSSANSSSRRLRIFANLTTAQQQQQQPQLPQQASQPPPPSFTLPVLGTSPNPPSLVPTTETTPNPSPGSDVS